MKNFKEFTEEFDIEVVLEESADYIMEELMCEGNPLARIHKHFSSGRQISVLSAQRSNLSPQENEARHKALKQDLKKMGYGYKEAEGHWEGGKEKSIIVMAKKTGGQAGNTLFSQMKKLGRKYGQDSVFHHNGQKGSLYGTNTTGWPGKGVSSPVGKVQYNRPEAEFQTETKPKSNKPLKTGRTDKGSARFTTADPE